MKARPRSNSQRARAWRNAMMAAINAGIEQELFGLQPGQNYWSERPKGHAYEFTVGDAPGIAWVGDAGWDELKFHVVLWPDAKARNWIHCGNLHNDPAIGAVVAEGWMERRDGCYLQPSVSLFRCRTAYKSRAVELNVQPRGYADHGAFRL